LPEAVRRQAFSAYLIWADNPHHSSLQFKRVNVRLPIYSVRIGIHWRACGLLKDDTVYWFWIGSHADYDQLLKSF